MNILISTLALATSIIAGIVYGTYTGANPAAPFAGILLTILYAYSIKPTFLYNYRKQIFLSTAICFFLGWFSVSMHENVFLMLKRQLQNSKAIIANVEECQQTQHSPISKFKLTLRIQKIKIKRLWYPLYNVKPIYLTILGSTKNFEVGTTVVINLYKLPQLPPSPKISIKSHDIRRRNVMTSIYKSGAIKKSNVPYEDIRSKITKVKNNLLEKIEKRLSDKPRKLYSSIFMGKRTLLYSDDSKNTFCYWGISHFLARSGLHMAIFASIIWLIFSLVPFLTHTVKNALSLIMFSLYWILSWPSVSFVRSAATAMLVCTGKSMFEKPNVIYLLTLVTMWTLTSNPFELFCIDFQLSFSLAFALIYFGKWLESRGYQKNQTL